MEEEYTVWVELTGEICITVTADDEEDARERAEEIIVDTYELDLWNVKATHVNRSKLK